MACGSSSGRASSDLPGELNIRCETDAPLGPLTWYGVGGRAAVLAHPADAAQLGALLAWCSGGRVPVYVLGKGANLLVADRGVDGVVVALDEPYFGRVAIDGERVTAGAGCDLMKLVMDAARAGLAGLEAVAGIPATVGGALRMNAGGAFGQIADCVSRVSFMSLDGRVHDRDRADIVFGYRRSDLPDGCILEATFDLRRAEPDAVKRRVKEIFDYKKQSQPMAASSAGCAFKNPSPPGEPPGDAPRLAAGQLIEQAGLKGFGIGGARVSTVHANFVVADGEGARADDVRAVIEHVQDTVQEKFGIRLEREVVIWP